MEEWNFSMSILSNMIERRMREKVEEDLKAQHADYSQDKIMAEAYEHMQKLADKLVEEYFKETK